MVATHGTILLSIPPTHRKNKRGGYKIVVGAVVKAKIGGLEEEVRAGFSRMMRKDFTGVFQGVYGKNMFEVRFQDG